MSSGRGPYVFAVSIVLALAAGAWTARQLGATLPWIPVVGYIVLSFILGIGVGMVDLITRYPAAPRLAILNPFGVGYLGLNGLISVAAFGFLQRYPDLVLSSYRSDLLIQCFVAGSGAMAVLRVKPLSGDKDAVFGPAYILEVFLRTLDRKIRGIQSEERRRLVYVEVPILSDRAQLDSAVLFIQSEFSSLQNLTQAEQDRFKAAVADATKADAIPQIGINAAVQAYIDITDVDSAPAFLARLRAHLGLPAPQRS